MKINSKTKKIIAILFTMIVVFGSISSTLYAMTSNYDVDTTSATSKGNENSMLTALTDILLPMFYPVFIGIETLTKNIVHNFTGTYSFPWADRIIFNSLPFLDVNFINPEPGSFFMNYNGTVTQVGKIVKSTYFTCLSICLGFFGLAVAINVIKMLIATLPSAKARYKELISATLISLIMIFGCHYIISFIFYINEQLVQVAADVSIKMINQETINKAQDNIYGAEEKNNEKLVENFFKKCNHTSWWSPITIIKSAVKGVINAAAATWDFCKNVIKGFADMIVGFFNSLFGGNGDNNDEKVTLSEDDEREGYYGKVFPSKEDFIGYFYDEDKVGKHGMDIAAYLLKDKIFRKEMLKTVAGNDTNKFTEAGIGGWIQSGLNTILWVTGISDTGLIGLQNLYDATWFVYNKVGTNSGISNNAESIKREINKKLDEETNATDDKTRHTRHLEGLYLKAYYRYVYEGDDKDELAEKSSMIQNLGEYFRRNVYYTDVDNKAWSPTTFDGIMCVLYCMFLVQSFIFLFSYFKRLMYVVILALLGPVTIVFDYIMKSY